MRNGFTNCIIQLSVNRVCRLGEEYPKLGGTVDTESGTQSPGDTSKGLSDSDDVVDKPKVTYSEETVDPAQFLTLKKLCRVHPKMEFKIRV